MSAYGVPGDARMFVVVHYNRHGLVVTDRTITNGVARYDITGIGGLGKSIGALHPGVWAALAVGVGEIVIVGASAAAAQSALALVVGAAALLVPCGVAVYCAVRWPREMCLLADYRGARVALFRTRDHVEFGKVSRAVQRAVELHHSAEF